jgi:hypothetical protein
MLILAILTAAAAATTTKVAVPGGAGGIGFDDLTFSPALHRLLVPGGRSGKLDLYDPVTKEVTVISGFSQEAEFGSGHGQGTTSADEGRGLIFASDRTRNLLVVVDPAKRAIVAQTRLSAAPDYVRFVALTGEIWVTEPGAEQIEFFSLPVSGTPTPAKEGVIHVSGGPESLVIDGKRNRAYTHLWKTETVAIDLHAHAVAGRWKNGCDGSRGIALDEERALLFAGCDEGKATVMDLQRGGAIVSTAPTGNGVDVIAWSPRLRHLYVPGEDSATMAVLAVADGGKLSLVVSVPTAKGAHCVAADDQGGAWICDPHGGQLLLFKDTPQAR